MTTDPESGTLALCRELVRIESPSGGEGGMAAAVARAMTALGYDEVRVDELGSVLGIRHGTATGGSAGGALLVDAHMDVVPATEPATWRFPPFAAERREGRIWGRGTTDVKGSLAAAVVGIGRLPRTELAGPVIVSASVGEERIEGLAVGHVLERHPVRAAIVCEPTGLAVGLGHRGRASLVVEAEGRAAHTSRAGSAGHPPGHPPKVGPGRGSGINAVYRLTEAIARVRAMTPRTDELLGRGHAELVEVSSLPFPGSAMVPYHATARFDRRLVRGETRDAVLAELAGALADLAGVSASLHVGELTCYTGATFTVEAFHPGWAVSPEAAHAVRARRALREAGLGDDVFYAPYSTNATATAGGRGLPTIVYGAGDISAAHAVDESVAEDELIAAARGYQALVRALA
jgi:putative selenium metabolism hydrolase